MKPKFYELIEHTADIGIKVEAQDLKALFKNAALAMFDIIAEKEKTKNNQQVKIEIEQKADNLEELFINWLNELLSLSATRELIFSNFKFHKLSHMELKATATGENTNHYKVNTEIKAATYHQLKLEEAHSGWQAAVIFDV